MPRSRKTRNGRITALCSMVEVTTRSPGRSSPKSARLIASVALAVKAMRELSAIPKNSASASRASKISRPAANPMA